MFKPASKGTEIHMLPLEDDEIGKLTKTLMRTFETIVLDFINTLVYQTVLKITMPLVKFKNKGIFKTKQNLV